MSNIQRKSIAARLIQECRLVQEYGVEKLAAKIWVWNIPRPEFFQDEGRR